MQLTKKEVVELIATISANSYRAVEDRIECITELSEWKQEEHLGLAKDIIQALEDSRILCLVEKPKSGDWVRPKNILNGIYLLRDDDLLYDVDGSKNSVIHKNVGVSVIQRNSIPAYHCKQETSGAE